MLSITTLSALSLPTITNNNIFGNNNQIIVNGASVFESPSPPSVSDVCGVDEPAIDLKRFPPQDLPKWGNPFQTGRKGYPAFLLEQSLLKGAVVEQAYNYPPYGISCLGFRALVNALSKNEHPVDKSLPDNTMFGLPQPIVVNKDAGESYMDYYMKWKDDTDDTNKVTDPRIKRIRKLFENLIDGFMFVLAFEQWAAPDSNDVAYSKMGTRYAAEMVLVENNPTILNVDAAGMGAEIPKIRKELFPLLPKLRETLTKLGEEYKANSTGMSGWFTDDKDKNYVAGINYVYTFNNIESHAISAITVGKSTGYTQEAINQIPLQFTADFKDAKIGTSGVEFQVVPEYEMKGDYPDGFEICLSAKIFYDFLKRIKTPTGKSFTCSQGAVLVESLSKLFKYEISVTSGKEPCNKKPEEVADWFHSMINAISVSQKISYGIYGNPILTPEQVRVSYTFILEIAKIHLQNLNVGLADLPSTCKAANVTYYGRPVSMWDYMITESAHYQEDPGSTDGFFSQSLGELAVATRDEISELFDQYYAVCPNFKQGVCPESHPEIAPVRLPKPVCDVEPDGVGGGDGLLANSLVESIVQVGGQGSIVSFAMTSCPVWLDVVKQFDDTYIGQPNQIGGCGFETYLSTTSGRISNYNSILADLCGTSCGRPGCPAPDPNAAAVAIGGAAAQVNALPLPPPDKAFTFVTSILYARVADPAKKAKVIGYLCQRPAKSVVLIMASLIPIANATGTNFYPGFSQIASSSDSLSTVAKVACAA